MKTYQAFTILFCVAPLFCVTLAAAAPQTQGAAASAEQPARTEAPNDDSKDSGELLYR